MTTTAAFAPTPAAAGPRVGWAELLPHRGALVRFAQRRLLDPTLAEDLVHDVFEAVATGRASFAGRAALRSWLTAILKHKIVDLVRQRTPWVSLDAGDAADDDAPPAHDVACPQPGPDELAEQRERLARTLERIEALPPTLREAFERRVLHEQDSAEVCRTLAISEENLFVRLHRARRQLLN